MSGRPEESPWIRSRISIQLYTKRERGEACGVISLCALVFVHAFCMTRQRLMYAYVTDTTRALAADTPPNLTGCKIARVAASACVYSCKRP